MRRTRTILASLVAVGLLLAIGAGSATTAKSPTTITVSVDFDLFPAPEAVTFTATSPAFCDSGTAFSVRGRLAGPTFHTPKTFVCDDGSGSVTFLVNGNFKTGLGGWRVLRGTGDHVGLNGGGRLVQTFQPGGGAGVVDLIDVYSGGLN